MFSRHLLTDVSLAILLALPTLSLAKPNLPKAVPAEAQTPQAMAELAEQAREPTPLG